MNFFLLPIESAAKTIATIKQAAVSPISTIPEGFHNYTG